MTSLEDAAELERIRELKGDLFVYAGGGIMRSGVLALPRLGTVNAHMGLLPQMRGMNVTEWGVFLGTPTGCTVHFIDQGIDTGDILLFRSVDGSKASEIAALRQQVDAAQIQALGDVVRWIVEHDSLPPARPQRAEEGRQYFSMHDDLRALVERQLSNDVPAGAGH